MGKEIHEGGCLCGAVRFRFRGPLVSVCFCHCSMCRRWAGSGTVPWVTIEKENYEITKGKMILFKSSKNAERGHCAACGSPMTYANRALGDFIDITIGALDHPEDFAPTHHIWTSTRLSWWPEDDLPAYPGRKPAT